MLLLLLLLGPGCGLGALVYQYPRRTICKSGTSMRMECQAVGFQATSVAWYRQSPQKTFELIALSTVNSAIKYEQNFTQEKFPISHPNLSFSSMTVLNAYLEDRGLYLCGARDTVLDKNNTL
ncbi:mCG146439, partial [Mus musculus]